jgi:hypothetical protein
MKDQFELQENQGETKEETNRRIPEDRIENQIKWKRRDGRGEGVEERKLGRREVKKNEERRRVQKDE